MPPTPRIVLLMGLSWLHVYPLKGALHNIRYGILLEELSEYYNSFFLIRMIKAVRERQILIVTSETQRHLEKVLRLLEKSQNYSNSKDIVVNLAAELDLPEAKDIQVLASKANPQILDEFYMLLEDLRDTEANLSISL